MCAAAAEVSNRTDHVSRRRRAHPLAGGRTRSCPGSELPDSPAASTPRPHGSRPCPRLCRPGVMASARPRPGCFPACAAQRLPGLPVSHTWLPHVGPLPWPPIRRGAALLLSQLLVSFSCCENLVSSPNLPACLRNHGFRSLRDWVNSKCGHRVRPVLWLCFHSVSEHVPGS